MSEPKDKFDGHEDAQLIGAIEEIGSIIAANYSEAIIIVNTKDKPIVWSNGDSYDILKLCAPIIRQLKSEVRKEIDC